MGATAQRYAAQAAAVNETPTPNPLVEPQVVRTPKYYSLARTPARLDGGHRPRSTLLRCDFPALTHPTLSPARHWIVQQIDYASKAFSAIEKGKPNWLRKPSNKQNRILRSRRVSTRLPAQADPRTARLSTMRMGRRQIAPSVPRFLVVRSRGRTPLVPLCQTTPAPRPAAFAGLPAAKPVRVPGKRAPGPRTSPT